MHDYSLVKFSHQLHTELLVYSVSRCAQTPSVKTGSVSERVS